mgnify:CR=1 FL=1
MIDDDDLRISILALFGYTEIGLIDDVRDRKVKLQTIYESSEDNGGVMGSSKPHEVHRT